MAGSADRTPIAGIQFDDGNITHFTVATPILRQYGLPGSFGVVTAGTDANPGAMTTAMLQEMVTYGYSFQDHTKDHNAAFWGDAVNAPLWRAHCLFSQGVFQRVGIAPMRAWNQPGGPGEGFTTALRDTLIACGYRYAAGRVALTSGQFRNMHYGAIDDPFSYGRWVFSWTYNAPAAALDEIGIDPVSAKGSRMLEAIAATINGNVAQANAILQACGLHEITTAIAIAAAWTWQAEVAAITRGYADAIAQGGFPIVVFHSIDANAALGLDAICAWLVDQDVEVLNMDDLVEVAQIDKTAHGYGVNLAAALDVDRNEDGRPDGFDQYAYIDMDGLAGNGAGTTVYGVPPGRLVISATVSEPLLQAYPDDFIMNYVKTVIDPVTFAYTTSQESRAHTIPADQSLTFADTLDIGERVDRVKIWFSGVWKQPFAIESLTATAMPNPTGVNDRTPSARLVVTTAPNPTAGLTTIAFNLNAPAVSSVGIYDVRGRLVERLCSNRLLDGRISMTWRNDHVPSGIYFARVAAGTVVETRKIAVVR